MNDSKRERTGLDTVSLAGRSWHALAPEEVARQLESSLDRGLTDAEAEARRQQFGPNRLAESRGRSAFSILVAQFGSLIVGLLVAAALISLLLGERLEAVAIVVVILLNAVIGFLTEWRAERALLALQKQVVPEANVIRGGTEKRVASAELVPGDLVVVAAGERVPADGRVVESVRLQIDEAALTGESHAVFKETNSRFEPNTPLGDRRNMAFMGTTITDGRGRILVTATAGQTEMGKVGALIEQATTQQTPLERKLTQLGHSLIAIVLVLCGIIVIAGYGRGLGFLPMLEVGISLAIAAVPEGLPAVATMTLAIGMQRMARRRALVRRLPAVETLGSTTVICTDKTGTLTKNEMTVQALVLDNRRIEVTGSGYTTAGEFRENGRTLDPKTDAHLRLALRIGALCNDAGIEHRDGASIVLGDPTEGALLIAAEKAGIDREALDRDEPRVNEVPFDSESKRMVTVHRNSDGETIAYMKGSPAAVIESCRGRVTGHGVEPLTDADREAILKANQALAEEALRVLGLAYRELPEEYDESDLDESYLFVGLVGMIDPLREEAKGAIATCRAAGIRTVMITGDQVATASALARQLDLDHDLQGRRLKTVHVSDLDGLDDEGWNRVARESAVFARVSPEYKLRIVEALQRQGEIVAMTGDGVNDAPALKTADIGVAMGIKGTEVAKETADMIITDDNFATIVNAVEQGRIIYANILKFIHYLFSCNFAEIITVFVAIMIGWPLPLGPLQILWMNLVTDVFPALALALEPSAPNMMRQPPRKPNERLLRPDFVTLIAWQGMMLAGLTLSVFAIGLRWYGDSGEGLRRAETLAFMTLALSQIFHAFNARSKSESIFTRRLFTNGWLWAAVAVCLLLQTVAVTLPLLRRVLHTTSPTLMEFLLVSAASLAPVLIVELFKLGRKRIQRPH